MANLSNFMEGVLADALFGRSSSYYTNSMPNTLYFALFTGLPDEAGQNGVEVSSANGSGYARRAVANVGSASAASTTLTFSGNPADADTVTIGGRTYTFKDTLAALNHVKRGASAADSRTNLVRAITGTGTPGTDYFTGTVVHADVTAAASGADATITALMIGTAGNSIATTEASSALSFPTATLTGGAGSGEFYQTPTATAGGAVKGVKVNQNTITFATALTAWGEVVGCGIYDAPTGGNLLFYGRLKNPRIIAKDDTFRFEAGALKATFNQPETGPDSVLSFFIQRQFLDAMFGRQSIYTIPSNLYFGLLTAMPGRDEALSAPTELAIGTNGYTRAVVPNNSTYFAAYGSGVKTNLLQIVWPTVTTAAWSGVLGVGIFDGPNLGAQLLAKFPLATTRTFEVGDPPRFAAQNFNFFPD